MQKLVRGLFVQQLSAFHSVACHDLYHSVACHDSYHSVACHDMYHSVTCHDLYHSSCRGPAERVDFRRVFSTKEDLRGRMEKRIKVSLFTLFFQCSFNSLNDVEDIRRIRGRSHKFPHLPCSPFSYLYNPVNTAQRHVHTWNGGRGCATSMTLIDWMPHMQLSSNVSFFNLIPTFIQRWG